MKLGSPRLLKQIRQIEKATKGNNPLCDCWTTANCLSKVILANRSARFSGSWARGEFQAISNLIPTDFIGCIGINQQRRQIQSSQLQIGKKIHRQLSSRQSEVIHREQLILGRLVRQSILVLKDNRSCSILRELFIVNQILRVVVSTNSQTTTKLTTFGSDSANPGNFDLLQQSQSNSQEAAAESIEEDLTNCLSQAILGNRSATNLRFN